MRYLLIQLILQILLQPGDFSEASSELVVCCKKAFPVAFQGFSVTDIVGISDDPDIIMPDMMDVLVDTLLSLLPQSSSRMCFAIEQVSFSSHDSYWFMFSSKIIKSVFFLSKRELV